MRRLFATLVALSLLMSMFTGVFASVPEARAAGPAAVNLGTAGNFVDSIRSRNYECSYISYYWKRWNNSNHRCIYYRIRLSRSDGNNIHCRRCWSCM